MTTLAYPPKTHAERIENLRSLMFSLVPAIELDTQARGGTKGTFFEMPASRTAWALAYPSLWKTLQKMHSVLFGGNIPDSQRLEAFDNLFRDYINDIYEDVAQMGAKWMTERAFEEWTGFHPHLLSWNAMVDAALDGFEPDPKESVFERAEKLGFNVVEYAKP